MEPHHPRPTLRRPGFRALGGVWALALEERETPKGLSFRHRIRLPFPPEAPLSGVGEAYCPVAWYRKAFRVPQGERVLPHFGAVDCRAVVYLDGFQLLEHEGGHTPFSLDLTPWAGRRVELLLRAEDDPQDLEKPRGKQAVGEPEGIFYPRTTGIWQTPWLEVLPHSHIHSLRLTPDLKAFGVHLEAEARGEGEALEVALDLGERVLWARFPVMGGRARGSLGLPQGGDPRAFLWSPENPRLFPLRLRLLKGEKVLDQAHSYAALREVRAHRGVFYLNGEPYFPKLTLDQGLWPEGHLAPPSLEALERDIRLAKALGFNGVREHQKLENPRYLHLADRLGLLVFPEMPSFFRFSPLAARRHLGELQEALARDYNHPSVVAWVLFNESWGLAPWTGETRGFLLAAFHLARALDPTRVLVDNDGWEHRLGDLYTVHDYAPPEVLLRRYAGPPPEAPMGRPLFLGEPGVRLFLFEFGGVGPGGEGWAYREVEDFRREVLRYLQAACGSRLAGFCYTQIYDTFQEKNGLLDAHRRPKLEPEALRRVLEGCEGVRLLAE